MSNNFFKSTDEYLEQRVNSKAAAFASRALKKVLALMPDSIGSELHPLGQYDWEHPFKWFAREFSSFPVALEARVVTPGFTPMRLLKQLTKTSLWRCYFDVFELHASRGKPVGMLFQFPKVGGIWVIHNHWALDGAPGFTRWVHKASGVRGGIAIEPLECFMQAVY